MASQSWQLQMGAQVIEGGRARFRVWAPAARSVEVEIYPSPGGIVRHSMAAEDDGVWSATVEAPAGILYRYRLDEQWGFPDPYSRSQPEGVHGPSRVVDPRAFSWSDDGWRGLDRESLVIYELHVGAYTPAGTFDAIIDRLDALRDLGVTALELMPVAEFPGLRNWGYDAAHLFAPCSAYGGPEALRRLVDAAHARALGVILDAVYNHRAADGDYLPAYSPDYYTDRYSTPWGHAVNFDGSDSRWVRRHYLDNALYWLHEFHIDGLRLDATHEMHDSSPKHILQELADAVHGQASRRFLLMAEDDRRDPLLVLSSGEGGHGLDALWVDDLHHSVFVLITGDRGRYHHSYEGSAGELARLLNTGALFSTTLGDQAASLAAIAPWRLINCLENHDQVGNDAQGRRLWQQLGLEVCKAAYALLLLVPGTPMLFMGDEFAASTPFLYFTDLRSGLVEQAKAGRSQELRQFWTVSGPLAPSLADAQMEETFRRSRLDWDERDRPPHDGVLRLFRELLRLRRDDPVLRTQSREHLRAEALATGVLAVERWNERGERRRLIVNFGEATRIDHGSPDAWRAVLSTAQARFAGPGVDLDALALRPGEAVELLARSAVLWTPGLLAPLALRPAMRYASSRQSTSVTRARRTHPFPSRTRK
jgi:maltooligosyltrehalose trehalohydrolase